MPVLHQQIFNFLSEHFLLLLVPLSPIFLKFLKHAGHISTLWSCLCHALCQIHKQQGMKSRLAELYSQVSFSSSSSKNTLVQIIPSLVPLLLLLSSPCYFSPWHIVPSNTTLYTYSSVSLTTKYALQRQGF